MIQFPFCFIFIAVEREEIYSHLLVFFMKRCAVKFLCPIPINYLIENTFILLRTTVVIAAHRLRHEQYCKTDCHSETDSDCADSNSSFQLTIMPYALYYKLADPPPIKSEIKVNAKPIFSIDEERAK